MTHSNHLAIIATINKDFLKKKLFLTIAVVLTENSLNIDISKLVSAIFYQIFIFFIK